MLGQTERRIVKSGVSKISKKPAGTSLPNKNAQLIGGAVNAPRAGFSGDSPDKRLLLHEDFHDAGEGLFIDWRKAPDDAAPNECEPLDHAYLKVFEGRLPRDTAKEEIQENDQEIRKAKVKEINGLYDLGCFKRWPRNNSHNIIGARGVITWKGIESNVGVQIRLTVRWFNDRLQYAYAGRLVVPARDSLMSSLQQTTSSYCLVLMYHKLSLEDWLSRNYRN